MDDITLLAADALYQKEFARWGMRYNKSFTPGRHEIYRSDRNGEPVVQAHSEDGDTAINEYEEMRAIAAMKRAANFLSR
jgi:hypothetical protein